MEWYLGGSRRMAQKHPDLVVIKHDTDFDYNVQHSQEAIALLERIGERQIGNPNYKDRQAVEFWILDGGVSVVTRKDLEIYKRAFELVGVEDYIKFHWKSSPYLTADFDKYKTRDYFNNLFSYVENQK